jgi:predicted RNase H-like nuclease (RuvC/YqgF family)
MNKNVLAAVLGVLLIASIGGNAYFYSQKGETAKAVQEKLQVLQMKDSLQRELQRMEDSLRPLLTSYQEENARLTGKIEDLEGGNNPKVVELMGQINSLRAIIARSGIPTSTGTGKTAALSKEDQKKLAELRKQLEEKQKEISDLMEKIAVLTKEVEAEKAGKVALIEENTEMKDRMNKGAIPQFGTLLTVGIGKKGGNQVENSKAKSAEKLRVTFDVLENSFIKEPVEEEVTIRIIGPEGEVLTSGNKGFADKSSLFSIKQTIISDGEKNVVKWYYPASGTLAGKLKKGKYSTELWTRGLLKQKNTFELY